MVAHADGAAIRAVLFDFDGVILESTTVKTDAFIELFSHLSAEQVAAVKRHHLESSGISRFKKFEWIYRTQLGRQISEAESAALGERFSQICFQRVLDAPFVPGALEALRALAATHLLFVVSGTPQGELDRIVDARELRPYFREVHGTPAEKPAIVRDILARFRIAPTQALFIGDGPSDHDAATATDVGFLARETAEQGDRWVRAGVRRAPDLRELPTLVASWNR